MSIILKTATIIVVMAASLVACDKAVAPAPAVDKAKIADAVKADAHELITAFNARDAAKAVSHDAKDMVGMFHGTPNVVGMDQDLAMTKQQFADNSVAKIEVSNESVDVAASGDIAVYRASYSFSGVDPKTKKAITETGNWVVGYKQEDGAWKIAWNVVSDAPAAPAAAPAATNSPAPKAK